MSAPDLRLIACEVLREEVERICAEEGIAPGTVWLEMGLHDEPEQLASALRQAVAATDPASCRAVLLLFGLCSNSTLGLAAPGVPLVIPRVHDCISLYLGSAARYSEEHERAPGTYWFSRGFLHRRDRGGGLMGHAPGEGEYSAARREVLYQQYVERYGEENAAFLMETWVEAWKRNYTRAVLLTWDYPELAADRARVQEFASGNNWRYEEIPADLRLVRMLLTNDWPEEEFLIVPPGKSIAAAHDCRVLCASRG